MVTALLVAGSSAKTLAALSRVMLDDRNTAAITDLTSVRPYALWLVTPALAAFAVVLWLLLRQEWAHVAEANPAKWLYQASSLALIAAIAYDPLAGSSRTWPRTRSSTRSSSTRPSNGGTRRCGRRCRCWAGSCATGGRGGPRSLCSSA
jgi:hypothetical protein